MWILDVDAKLLSFEKEGKYRRKFSVQVRIYDCFANAWSNTILLLIESVSAKIINDYKCLLCKHSLMAVTTCMCANYMVYNLINID